MNEYQPYNEYFNAQQNLAQKPEFTRNHSVFSPISLVIGYLFMRFVFMSDLGVSATVFTFIFIFFGISYLVLSKKPYQINKTMLFVILIFSCNFFIIDNTFIKFLNLLFVAVLSVYFLYCSSGKREQKNIGDMLFFDLVKMLFIYPFASFGKGPSAISSGSKNSGLTKKISLIILTLIAVIPITVIILSLLLSADESFSKLFGSIFSNITDDIALNIFLVIFGIPVALYFFGFLYSCENGLANDGLTEEKNRGLLQRLKITPEFIFITAMIPLLLIYILFFVSQLAYFTSAFQNILPEGFIPAEYARKGFFQICVVAFINGIIIAIIGLMTKRKENKLSPVFKIFISILSLLTLLFIATAISKMVLYIGFFGLTPLRVYVTWFLGLLTALFILALIKQIIRKLNLTKAFSVVFVIMFFLLTFSNVDALIAKYNIDRYKDGSLNSVDFEMLETLSDAAVRYVEPLTKDKDDSIAYEAKEFMENKKNSISIKGSFYDFNIDTYLAKKLLTEKAKG